MRAYYFVAKRDERVLEGRQKLSAVDDGFDKNRDGEGDANDNVDRDKDEYCSNDEEGEYIILVTGTDGIPHATQ
eukprot:15268731-Ditylum_brightwellii.AAC.1